MDLQLTLLEAPKADGAAPVWDALDEAPRAEVVRVLARLLAKVASSQLALADGEERNHE